MLSPHSTAVRGSYVIPNKQLNLKNHIREAWRSVAIYNVFSILVSWRPKFTIVQSRQRKTISKKNILKRRHPMLLVIIIRGQSLFRTPIVHTDMCADIKYVDAVKCMHFHYIKYRE
jgi:hypothetical protein